MKQRFLILGGDLRSIKLAEMLINENNKVFSFGLEKSEEIEENNQIDKMSNLSNAIDKVDIIIAPTPFSRNGESINSPFSNEEIKIEQLIKSNKNKIFIAGGIKEHIMKQLEEKYFKVIDLMRREELSVLNTIATAEGAIEVAIKHTDKILQGSNVLILGFGRVAKIVANKFSLLSTNVTCAARKTTDLAWIEAYGYESININDMLYDLKDFDIIINTVPQIIIKEKELKHLKHDVLLIDLASNPGGIESQTAIRMGLKYEWALALPRKSCSSIISRIYKRDYIQCFGRIWKKYCRKNTIKNGKKFQKTIDKYK